MGQLWTISGLISHTNRPMSHFNAEKKEREKLQCNTWTFLPTILNFQANLYKSLK